MWKDGHQTVALLGEGGTPRRRALVGGSEVTGKFNSVAQWCHNLSALSTVINVFDNRIPRKLHADVELSFLLK